MPDTPHNRPDRRPSEAAYWFLFDRDRLLLRHNTDGWYIPLAAEPPVEAAAAMEITGQVARTTPGPEPASNTIRYFASSVEVPQPAPAGMEWVALRASYDLLGERVYALAGKAFELVHWERNSRFCPACGTGMEPHSEISRRCPTCGKELFPAISPAIIVLICKGDSILLARTCYSRSPFMGLVAGFLETGESLEACVHREVFEETGLQIRNLRYFGNQPWPYPSGLMVGFIADYDRDGF